jgi:hypothetical protein
MVSSNVLQRGYQKAAIGQARKTSHVAVFGCKYVRHAFVQKRRCGPSGHQTRRTLGKLGRTEAMRSSSRCFFDLDRRA